MLEKLSDEMLVHVLHFADCQTRTRVAQVNRRLQRVADDRTGYRDQFARHFPEYFTGTVEHLLEHALRQPARPQAQQGNLGVPFARSAALRHMLGEENDASCEQALVENVIARLPDHTPHKTQVLSQVASDLVALDWKKIYRMVYVGSGKSREDSAERLIQSEMPLKSNRRAIRKRESYYQRMSDWKLRIRAMRAGAITDSTVSALIALPIYVVYAGLKGLTVTEEATIMTREVTRRTSKANSGDALWLLESYLDRVCPM